MKLKWLCEHYYYKQSLHYFRIIVCERQKYLFSKVKMNSYLILCIHYLWQVIINLEYQSGLLSSPKKIILLFNSYFTTINRSLTCRPILGNHTSVNRRAEMRWNVNPYLPSTTLIKLLNLVTGYTTSITLVSKAPIPRRNQNQCR